jgi:hypothetical protein
MLFSFQGFIIYIQVMCVTLNESDVIKSEHRWHIFNRQNTNILWMTYLFMRDLPPYNIQ